MKILMVAIPNHHFFQWVNQLKDSGYEVAWFDITDGDGFSKKIEWVQQYNGWQLRWDFPFRTKIKKYLPRTYAFLQKFNQRNSASKFEKIIDTFCPDVIHCFEMQLTGLPLLKVLEKHNSMPLVYSSWGSDMFAYESLGVTKIELRRFLNRVNFLITDCERDYKIAVANGFENAFLGVFPGNGGIHFNTDLIKPVSERNTILIKGYDDGVGKAIEVLKALENITPLLLTNKKIVVFSTDDDVNDYLNNSIFFKERNVEVIKRTTFLSNEKLLKIMGESSIYIGNSISDGMPNTLLEAMGMGAFPIQSNPGRVTEEVITKGTNGFLIENPLAVNEITTAIEKAIQNVELREKAQNYNINWIQKKYDRATLQPKIVSLYASIYAQSKK